MRLLVLAAALTACGPGAPSRHLELVGEGSAEVLYDTVYLKAIVNWQSSIESVARAGAEAADEAVVAVFRAAGALERDMRSGRIDVYPSDASRGFVATSVIEGRIPSPERAAGVVAAVIVAAKKTHATLHWHQPFLEVAHPAEELEAARKAAFADARRRARELARVQGVSVGKVISIVEKSAAQPPRVELKVWLPDQGKTPDVKAFLDKVQLKPVQLVKLQVRFEVR
jgi:uncharacterized protein